MNETSSVHHKKIWLAYKTLTVASTKMYFRNRTALFFTLFIPIMLILIFGAFNSTKQSTFKLDIVNDSNSQISKQFVDSLTNNKDVFNAQQNNIDTAKNRLDNGKTDIVIVVPKEFGELDPNSQQLNQAQIKTYYNKV